MAVTVTTARPGIGFPAPAGAVPRLGPVARCPRCRQVLDGGPVAYHCVGCGRGVMAADIGTDYHPHAEADLTAPTSRSRAEEGPS